MLFRVEEETILTDALGKYIDQEKAEPEYRCRSVFYPSLAHPFTPTYTHCSLLFFVFLWVLFAECWHMCTQLMETCTPKL